MAKVLRFIGNKIGESTLLSGATQDFLFGVFLKESFCRCAPTGLRSNSSQTIRPISEFHLAVCNYPLVCCEICMVPAVVSTHDMV